MLHFERGHRAKSTVIFVCMAVLFAGCDSQGTHGMDMAAIESAVIESVRAFEQAENERNAERLLGFLDEDFYMYQDGERVDYETVVQQIRTTLPSLQSFEARFEDIEVEVLSPHSAMVSMLFFDKIIDQDGNETEMWGPTTFLWKRENGQWRIAYADSDHYPVEKP
jgi:ketosteroid isomerase-like protein